MLIDTASHLPRKIVITSMDDPERPQYTTQLRWGCRNTHYDDGDVPLQTARGRHEDRFREGQVGQSNGEIDMSASRL